MAIPLTAREPVEFTPPSLPKRLQGTDPSDASLHRVRIKVRVPTMMERDSYASALVRGGVMHYTKQQIRDISLAGIQELFPAEEHEDKQAMLRELWAVADDEAERMKLEYDILREEQEKAKSEKRDIDLEKVKERCAEIEAEVVMDHHRRIEATALSQQVLARFAPLNEAIAALADQDAKRAWLNARIYVIGWTGLEHQPDPPGMAGLKQHEVEYLRREIGEDAFGELSDFITRMMGIDEDEEKNLLSLLEDTSAPIGSTQQESTASSDDGASTDGPSTTIPESESPKTIKSLSSSSTNSKTRTGRSKRGRTGSRSSRSR